MRHYKGYGQAQVWVPGKGPRLRYVHRLSAVELAGAVQLASKDLVCHQCDNRSCLNPAHLAVGDVARNHREMMTRGRNGHKGRTPYQDEQRLLKERLAISQALTEGRITVEEALRAFEEEVVVRCPHYGEPPPAQEPGWWHLMDEMTQAIEAELFPDQPWSTPCV